MSNKRVIYQNWIAELGLDPVQIKKFFDTVAGEAPSSAEVDGEVRRAIESLGEEEMEFVIRFYFMGQSYYEISEKSGRAVYKLESLHKRANRRLKSRLRSFMRIKYGIKSKSGKPCALCRSPHRDAINGLIAGKKEKSTWKPVMKEIHRQFGIKIRSPQVVIGHLKYHLTPK